MKISAVQRRVFRFLLFAGCAGLLIGGRPVLSEKTAPAAGAVPPAFETAPEPRALSNYDVRLDERADARPADSAGRRFEKEAAFARRHAAAAERLRGFVPTLRVELSRTLAAPEVIGPDVTQGRAFLSAARTGPRSELLREFLRENRELFGLSGAQVASLAAVAEYANPDGHLSFAHLAQEFGGVRVFQGEAKAGFTRRGELVRVISNLAPEIDESALSRDFGAPEEAVRRAFDFVSRPIEAADVDLDRARSAAGKFVFGAGAAATSAEKVYFPLAAGAARPAWLVLIWEREAAYYVVVDAASGALLWRKNIVEHQTQPATYNVYFNPNNLLRAADSPSPLSPGALDPGSGTQPPLIARTNRTLVGNEPPYDFNAAGWIPDGANETAGNNVVAGIDRNQPYEDGVDREGKAYGVPARSFVFDYAPGDASGGGDAPAPPVQTYPPLPYQQGSVTNLFYLTNRYHDELYLFGFTEQARNFQNDNFGRGGAGDDRVSAEAQDARGVNNANFATPQDGTYGRMQMYLWDRMTPDRDGSLDAEIVVHELTHGLSNRLHGNALGLSDNLSRGMGEGWSDFYALAMLSEPSDAAGGVYPIGGYPTFQIQPGFVGNYYYGVRRFPRALRSSVGANNRPHDPLTFADLDLNSFDIADGAFARGPVGSATPDQVHNAGEIWCGALWEARARFIERLGHAAGTRRVLQLVTDGMKLAPINPTFLQERDAIIAAARASRANAPLAEQDAADFWAGFAARGMGFSAELYVPSPQALVSEAFDTPNLRQAPALTVTDAAGNNNGFPDPGERISLNIPLRNQTGTTAAGVTLRVAGGPVVDYGTIPHNAGAARDVALTVPATTACGSLLTVNLQIDSSLGATVLPVEIAVGRPQTAFAENFDAVAAPQLPAGWTSAASGLGINWATTVDNPQSPPNAILTYDVSAAGGAELTSPAVAVAAEAARLRFRHLYATQANTDGGVLEISIAGGAFEDVLRAGGRLTSGGYNGVVRGTGNPLGARRGWTGFSDGYLTTELRLPAAAAGRTVRFRWRMGHNESVGGDRWQIDNVEVLDNFGCAPVVPAARPRADFDGDGKTDVSVFRGGIWYQLRSSQGFVAQSWGLASDTLTPGDFDGDGRTDPAVFRPDPAGADFYVLQSASDSLLAIDWGSAGDKPANGDFDGDGRDDFAVFRPSGGVWFILPASGGAAMIAPFGRSGDLPAAADYDGDGRADRAVFRADGAAGAEWWIDRSTAGLTAFQFGAAGDRPVFGDYTGDGKADAAVFRPANGFWYVLRSEDFSFYAAPFGLAGDVPVPADYDGDRRTDFAVFRGGVWYLLRSQTGLTTATFGLPADVPVPAAYLP